MSAPNVGENSTQPTTRKQLSILVVQMGEIDEIFRALMALKAIKHLYPEVSIHFMARKEVSAPLRRVDWLSSVIETPAIKDSAKENEDPVQKVAVWIDQVINQHYDILANWTFSGRYARMAAIATSLVPAMIKVGDHIREDLTVGSYDAWSMYRQAWLKGTIEQDIHHTDIITTQLLTVLQIHAGDPAPDVTSSAVTSRYFFKNSTAHAASPALEKWNLRTKNLKWIALHASSCGERGSELIEAILRRHPEAGVVIIDEEKSIWEYEENARVVDLSGTLHFDSSIQVLSQASWLVSGPGAIADLASLMNIRCLYLADPQENLSSLKWTENGPYGNGHVVMVSKEEWRPELAYAAWSYYNSEWFHKGSFDVPTHFENLGVLSAWNSIHVFKSRIRPAGEGGGVCYERVGTAAHSFENWMFRVRGQLARAWFCGWLPSIETEVARLKLDPALIKRVREVKESLQVISRLCAQGKEIAKELKVSAESVKSSRVMSIEDRTAIEEHGKKLLEIEALIARVTTVEPELTCLLKWYQQMLHNLVGETISAMAAETVHAFELVIEGVDLMQLYAQKTLDLAKPKAIASETRLHPVTTSS